MVVNCRELIFYCSFHYMKEEHLLIYKNGKRERKKEDEKVKSNYFWLIVSKCQTKKKKMKKKIGNRQTKTVPPQWQIDNCTGLSKIMALYPSSSSCNFLSPPPSSSHQPPHHATATTVVTNYLPCFSPFLLPPPPDSHHLPRIRSWIRLQEQMDPHPPPPAPIQSWPLEKLLCIPFVW